uniref:Putative secreted protein n=1 Tax=Ixodes ricinus TaxID=34613 RepID=A0A6B0U2Z8_IXORI
MRRLGKSVLTFAEKCSLLASIKLLVIAAHLTGFSKPSAMSSRIENRSRKDAADVALTTPPKRLQPWSWGPPFF